ncbi:hydrocephalus-inducing protein-like isoform X2 [Passer domesticus]
MEEKETGKEKGSCEDRAASLRAPGEMAKVHQDPMFSDDVSFIEPMEGEIEPDGLAKIKMTFKPLEAVEYQSVACCSISGRENRLPLQLRGEGQGPLVELSCDTLDLGDIFVNTPHVCEVNLINQGALDAPFSYIPSATKVGLGFKLAPQEGIIAAGGSQTLQISFSATVLGRFEEEFRFSLAGSPTPAILTIKGSVTGPSLHFDLPELDFGDISFGFPYTQRCRLTNSSPVPVTFQLRMSFDGTQPAVDSVDQIRCHSDPAWRKGIHFYVEPREFTITPSRGTILPQGHQDIQVTLCSNSVMEFYRKMLVDLEGFGKGVASLVITARCLVPKLQVSPHVLQYDECLLKVPYEKKFLIRNPSHLPGCYGLIEQKRKEDAAVLYSSPRPCGIVQPHSTAEIPVLVEVQALGTHRTNVLIGVFGDERNPLRKQLWSSGQLAETSPSPRLMESGRIPALQPIDELHPPQFTPHPPKEMRTCLDCPVSRWRHFKAGKQEAATALTEEQDLTQSSGVEASSILPVSGVLQPGESQQVSLPFSGHLNSISSATALCHVEGGPSSEVLVPGEASRASCSPSPQEISCGSGAPLRERRELKRPAPKLEEETKALEEEERQKEKEKQKKAKKGVSVGKEPPKAEKGKTKPPEKKESKAPEKKDTKIPERMETKAPDKIETKLPEKKNKHPEKKETKFPERKESKAPEKKDTKALLEKKENKFLEKKETKAPEKIENKLPEKKYKPPEKRESKFPEKKETKAPEKIENKLPEKKYKPPEKRESKFPEKKETKAPEKIENKLPEKKYKPPEKREIKIPERKESKAPERKEVKILKKESKSPEKRSKPPEKKETKCPERKEIKIPEKESKAPKKKEPKAPKKGEAKVPEKRETKAPKKKEPKAPKKGEAKA